MRLLLVVVAGLARVASAQWGTPTQVSMAGANVFGSAVAASGTTVHLAFNDNGIRYRRSTDEGLTWSAPVLIAPARCT